MKHILAIDDEEIIRTVLHEFLTGLGYAVKVASNGIEALELFRKRQRFDLVITDIIMPKLDGNEVATHIRDSNTPETPIIAITGSCDDITDRKLFDTILIKPFSLKSLEDTISSYI